jgi:hypothetical protein
MSDYTPFSYERKTNPKMADDLTSMFNMFEMYYDNFSDLLDKARELYKEFIHYRDDSMIVSVCVYDAIRLTRNPAYSMKSFCYQYEIKNPQNFVDSYNTMTFHRYIKEPLE